MHAPHKNHSCPRLIVVELSHHPTHTFVFLVLLQLFTMLTPEEEDKLRGYVNMDSDPSIQGAAELLGYGKTFVSFFFVISFSFFFFHIPLHPSYSSCLASSHFLPFSDY
jgi:hypothetical protein